MTLLLKCKEMMNSLRNFDLPAVKPFRCDLSDSGLHRSRDDSAQNEAERTNSAISDSIVDGSTIEWNKHKLFDDLTDEEIGKLTLDQYEQHDREVKRMEKTLGMLQKKFKTESTGHLFRENLFQHSLQNHKKNSSFLI